MLYRGDVLPRTATLWHVFDVFDGFVYEENFNALSVAPPRTSVPWVRQGDDKKKKKETTHDVRGGIVRNMSHGNHGARYDTRHDNTRVRHT